MDISLEIWTNYIKILFLYHTLVVVRPTNILQEGTISPQTSSKIQKQLLGGQKPNWRSALDNRKMGKTCLIKLIFVPTQISQ